ncbi:MAG: hypothetical protein RR651_13800 [Lysinibacillus sp.]
MTTKDFNQAFKNIQHAFDDGQYADVLEQVDNAIELGILANERFAVAKLFNFKVDS